ncbi:DoxX family protein [Bradyrhizobium zhanjiangense]|uniref:DoxX family protein n=1 Tax=Bradyrhizobium zhanjiangense TaxID=1325107 RepID=A0ABY0DPV4_9BRAD|nr:DoxX family protein [Bradyrhizobium zhanjiangense]RXG97660.1 DoxX family protein [Bradyrhizobium zhanjiangense]
MIRSLAYSGAVLRQQSDEAVTMTFRSPWPTSQIDKFATSNADLLILIGRVLLAWVFVGSAYGALTNFSGSVGYFRSLNLPMPQLFTTVTVLLEILISVGLILGIGTRYCAILVLLFVVAATAIAHRYWEYPAGPQQIGQYNNFLKNISILGGALLILVTGGGRFSLDRRLAG